MPKETIQYPTTDKTSGTEITVHWLKDAHVQIEARRHTWLKPLEPQTQKHLTDCECLTAESDCGAMPDTPESDGAIDEESVVWTDVLTRAEINKMIRVLRRARDQVFGADE